MAFTVGELDNIANSALDFYLRRGTQFKQTIQEKPLLNDMDESNNDTIPGGKGDIRLSVKGTFGAGGTNDTLVGYTHNDTLGFYNPTNNKQVNYPWREHHLGISVTHTELKMDGISVVDTNGASVSNHTDRDKTVITGLWQTKLDDFAEQYARSLSGLLWGDGSGDAKALAGLRYFISTTPTTGTVGGINRATAGNEYWRNRALLSITSSTANGGALLQALQKEYLQLIRYGGRPTKMYAGSDFMDALQTEKRANGLYFQGAPSNTADVIDMGNMTAAKTSIVYEPALDDLGFAKRAYWVDLKRIRLAKMQNEWRKVHVPARPYNSMAIYRSITCTGQMIAEQCNSSGVYSIA